MAFLKFNSADVEPAEDFPLMPVSWQLAEIIESEITPNKKNTGEVLCLVWKITEGEFSGRQLSDWLNISHDNPIAQRIAQQKLASICEAVGVGEISDSEELHFKPAYIRILQEKGDRGDLVNKIGKVAAPDGQLNEPASRAAPRQQTSRPAASARQPEQTRPTQTERQPASGPAPGRTGPWAGRTR